MPGRQRLIWTLLVPRGPAGRVAGPVEKVDEKLFFAVSLDYLSRAPAIHCRSNLQHNYLVFHNPLLTAHPPLVSSFLFCPVVCPSRLVFWYFLQQWSPVRTVISTLLFPRAAPPLCQMIVSPQAKKVLACNLPSLASSTPHPTVTVTVCPLHTPPHFHNLTFIPKSPLPS